MKKKLFAALLIAAAVLSLCFGALAADDTNLKISMDLSANKFSEPKNITVSITISNAGEGDMPGPITLYYPNGNQVKEFGSPTLTVGNSASWTGTWKVTQAQLESGRITFKIKYSIYNEDGDLVNKTKSFSKAIKYTGAVTSAEINRTITPTTAREGQEVAVTYEVVNTGTTNITDVSIKEHSSISSKKGTIDAVKPGEKQSYTFKTTMGTKDLTSEATITYKAAGATQTVKKEKQTIKYGEVKLNATLKADKKGGAVGDAATLTLTLKNTGNQTISGISVTDPVLGTVWSDQTVEAGKTLTLETNLTLNDTQDYQFTVTGSDDAGNTVETATDRVTLTVLDPSQAITLTVNAVPDRTVVYTVPAVVKFTISVTNNSTVDVETVNVYAVNTRLYQFSGIPAGETATFVRDVSISMDGTYVFEARCNDQLGQPLSFTSNSNWIAYQAPTPVPTAAPIVTPPAPHYEEMPTDDGMEDLDQVQDILGIAWKVLAGIAAVFGALGIIGLISHAVKGGKRKKAVDTLDEGGSYRDYHNKTNNKKRHIITEAPEAAHEEMPVEQEDETGLAPEMPEAPAEGDAMAEALARVYPNGVPAQDEDIYEVEEPQQTEPAPAASEKTVTVTDAANFSRRRRGN